MDVCVLFYIFAAVATFKSCVEKNWNGCRIFVTCKIVIFLLLYKSHEIPCTNLSGYKRWPSKNWLQSPCLKCS